MKQGKTIAGRLAWWAVLPFMVLTAAVAVYIMIWNLRFESKGQNPNYGQDSRLETPADAAAFDRDLFMLISGQQSGQCAIQVDIAVNDAGEVIYKSHIGYVVFRDRWPERFLVLDGFPMEELAELPATGKRLYASGRDDGFYFYVDSLEIYHNDKIIFSQGSAEPGPHSFTFQDSIDQYIELAGSRRGKNMLTGLSNENWPDKDEYWRMYTALMMSESDGPVTCREEAYSRPDRKSFLGSSVWHEVTYETIYPNYYPDGGLHIYSRVLESPISAVLASGWRVILIMAAVSVLAALYIYIAVQHLVTKPLECAIQKTEGLTDSDIHFWQMELNRPDELGMLSRSLKTVQEDFQKKYATESAVEQKK